ncbi:MAG TPA: hypothetical protein VFG12_10280 [Rhodopila sp.]|jgi:hypothetical protein|nr:hypothetical protein [Rhodopila sp.]
MTTYDFLLRIDVNGAAEQRAFRIHAETLSSAVVRSLDALVRDQPEALFKGLTYYAPFRDSADQHRSVA